MYARWNRTLLCIGQNTGMVGREFSLCVVFTMILLLVLVIGKACIITFRLFLTSFLFSLSQLHSTTWC